MVVHLLPLYMLKWQRFWTNLEFVFNQVIIFGYVCSVCLESERLKVCVQNWDPFLSRAFLASDEHPLGEHDGSWRPCESNLILFNKSSESANTCLCWDELKLRWIKNCLIISLYSFVRDRNIYENNLCHTLVFLLFGLHKNVYNNNYHNKNNYIYIYIYIYPSMYDSVCERVQHSVTMWTTCFSVHRTVSVYTELCLSVHSNMFQCAQKYVSVCTTLCFSVPSTMFQGVLRYVSGCAQECNWSTYHLHLAVHKARDSSHHCVPCTWLHVWQRDLRTHHLRLWRPGDDGNGLFSSKTFLLFTLIFASEIRDSHHPLSTSKSPYLDPSLL